MKIISTPLIINKVINENMKKDNMSEYFDIADFEDLGTLTDPNLFDVICNKITAYVLESTQLSELKGISWKLILDEKFPVMLSLKFFRILNKDVHLDDCLRLIFEKYNENNVLEYFSSNKMFDLARLEKIHVYNKSIPVSFLRKSMELSFKPLEEELKQQFLANKSVREFAKSNNDNFAIVLGYIPEGIKSSHTHLVLNIVKALLTVSDNSEVILIITDEYDFNIDSCASASFPKNKNLISDESDIVKERFNNIELKRFKVFHAKSKIHVNDTIQAKYNCCLGELLKFNPKVVYGFGGGATEAVFFPGIIKEVFPTVFMPFNIQTKVPAAFDYVISHWKDFTFPTKVKTKYCHLIAEPQPRLPPFFEDNDRFFDGKGVNLVSGFSRNQLHLALEKWKNIFLSDGNKSTLFDAFIGLFECYSDLKWYIVGRVEKSDLSSVDESIELLIKQGRVILVPYISDLRGFFRECDIYLQPIGFTGSGNTSILAAAECKPVVSMSDSDPAAYFPNNYFPKTNEEYIKHLNMLIKTKELRDGLGTSFHYETTFDNYTRVGRILSQIHI